MKEPTNRQGLRKTFGR